MNRRHRLLAALLAAFALAFAQLAVSAHACQIAGQPLTASMPAPHDCCEEDPAGDGRDNLCAGHCLYGDASFDGGQSSSVLAASCGPGLRVDCVNPAEPADGPAARRLEPPGAPPPVAILFGVLRI